VDGLAVEMVVDDMVLLPPSGSPSFAFGFELRVKALHRLRSVPMTAAPSGVVSLLVGVVVEF
jgi:hypothetical protein